MRQQPQKQPVATSARSPEAPDSTQTVGEDFEPAGTQLLEGQAPLTPRGLLQLQRTAGNYAVERYVISGLVSRASNTDPEEIKKINERIRRLNEGRAGQIRIGPDGRPMQPTQIPPRRVPAGTGPGGTAAGVGSEAGSIAQDSLKVGEGGAVGERAALQSRFYDIIRKAGARVQQSEVRAKIAAILAEKGLTVAGREGAVAATSEVPPLAALVQAVVAIQDVFTFGEVVWEIATLLAG